MKVTVCFGNVRVVVPCGNGDLLVRDLMREASLRYKKATGKSDTWLVIHSLQSSSGILDPDDRLSWVCDDRESLSASWTVGGVSGVGGGGDGASGSSQGSPSPELRLPRTDIEVTGEAAGVKGLQVRRGSEPSLQEDAKRAEERKRWSAAVMDSPEVPPPYSPSPDPDSPPHSPHFRMRDSARLSIQFLGDQGYRWAEAADSANQRLGTSLPRDHRRKEPLGQANSSEDGAELVVIRNEPGPLGIHVVPDYDRLGKDKGLVVQGIEPNGRIERDGKLKIGDRIIEINGQSVLNMPFQRVQEMFKLSLIATELRLKVIKSRPPETGSLRKPPAPVYPKTGTPGRFPEDKENVAMVEVEEHLSGNTKVATVSPTKKIPSSSRNPKSLLTANTRKIGRKIELELTKGMHGLGFSITTRDNPAGGNCPIYIKNILPKGAAVEDGRLKPGDRLLEVNGIEMTGKSQAEAVAVLRNAPPGSKVKIVVSRQEEATGPALPREIGADGSDLTTPPAIPPLPVSVSRTTPDRTSASVQNIIAHFNKSPNPPEKLSADDNNYPWKHREILTFDIPVHDSEKAGLGVSVKGKTSSSPGGGTDLGIFVKSVLHGGAASRDKRLRTNDQLLNVNGVSLLQQSNSEAMETLRKAMISEGPKKGMISLMVARRAASPSPKGNSSGADSTNNSTETDTSANSESSGNTVIFLPYKDPPFSPVSPQKSPPYWNPVIDRLTGQKPGIRNDSYYLATHDTWNSTMIMNTMSDKHSSPTVNLPSGETVIIEEEPPKLENRNEVEPDGKASVSSSVDRTNETSTDVTYASQLSLETGQGFSRDAFGRQSMSEKRHATLDAKSTGTYQRNKKLREEREKQKPKDANLVRVGSVESIISLNRSPIHHPEYADKLGQLGPSLGMKKSSSLESLQTMVQEIQMQEESDPAYSYRNPNLKVIRGRGCDESFRAAVVDPDHRSETTAKKHWLLDPPENRPGLSGHSGPSETNEREIDGFSNVRGGPRQSSLNALDIKHKGNKKNKGILKGIGSMFRFGKHRKTDLGLENFTENAENELQNDSESTIDSHQQSNQQSNQQNHQQSHHHQQQQSIISSDGITVVSANKYYIRDENDRRIINDNSLSRAEKVHQLRSQHQQRHADRLGQYPNEDREEHYEEVIRQRLDHPNIDYRQMRPGSRSGISDPVRFNHYVNYDELQHQLSTRNEQLSENQIVQMRMQVQQQRNKVEEESRKQHQYHSQRQPRSDLQRPVSNFYEYESIQSLMHQRGRSPMTHNGSCTPPNDLNSNSLPRHNQNQVQTRHFHPQPRMRQYQSPPGHSGPPQGHPSHPGHQYQRYVPSQHPVRLRGPFVTHVTIGSDGKGSKV